jgi:predicted RNA-binding Zn ribbon-like protein
MEALPLNPGGYGGTYKLIAGRMSLDFVNTVSWPDFPKRHDWFESPGNVVRWLKAVGLPPGDSKHADLVSLADMRTALTAVLRPLAHGSQPTKAAIDKFNEYLSAANSRRMIARVTLVWTWKTPKTLIDAFAPVVLDAADVITAGPRDRLRYCPACDWLFEDQTRNGQRRWCDMADCGSRDKSRRYYHRNK